MQSVLAAQYCLVVSPFLSPFLPFFPRVSPSASSAKLWVSSTLSSSRACSAAFLAARQIRRRPRPVRICGPTSTRIHHAFSTMSCVYSTHQSHLVLNSFPSFLQRIFLALSPLLFLRVPPKPELLFLSLFLLSPLLFSRLLRSALLSRLLRSLLLLMLAFLPLLKTQWFLTRQLLLPCLFLILLFCLFLSFCLSFSFLFLLSFYLPLPAFVSCSSSSFRRPHSQPISFLGSLPFSSSPHSHFFFLIALFLSVFIHPRPSNDRAHFPFLSFSQQPQNLFLSLLRSSPSVASSSPRSELGV